jgi:pimeloyl-ACP methyl ester carboxylesterase
MVMDFRWPPPPDGRPERYRPPASRGPQTGRPTLPQPLTELVSTPHGVELERLVTGDGLPVTVYAHGLGCSITDTRPLASAVVGRRVFFHFRGHGGSATPPGRWTHADLARDLRAIADLSGATRALGVSLGAAALCRLLADHPTRFERVVLFLPPALDGARTTAGRVRQAELLGAAAAGDAATVAELISQEIPPQVRQTAAVWEYLRQRLDQLMRDGLAAGLADLPDLVAVDDLAALGAVTAPVLVIACNGDETHPVQTARRLHEALPNATLHEYDRPGVFWTRRADLRDRISEFLNTP